MDTPIVVEAREEDEELRRDQASKFRRFAALANYLALDWPDLQVAVSVLCQKMTQPTVGSWLQLKRVARYLQKYPVLLYEFWHDGEDLELKVFSDSDWAGDRDTRRSRSGGVALLAGCTVKSWSNRQATPAMSSAEAEYYSMVKASAASRPSRRTWAGRCVFACAWTAVPREPWLPGAAWGEYATWRCGSCGCKTS